MKHRTARAFRAGVGWQSRCSCGWKSEWTAEVVEARSDGLAHEAQPDAVDWSVVESWLRQR